VADMGENIAGWARLRVRGGAGTEVRLRYGELLHEDGALNVKTSCCGQIKEGRLPRSSPHAPVTAYQGDTYILKGKGTETYEPRFTFHGFRYVEVTGYPGRPGKDDIQAVVLASSVPSAGSFSCSSPLLNRIQDMTRRTLLGNLFSVQSDCPHREKFGYGGDIVASSEMAIFNFDMAAFYAKSVRDFSDAARPNGGFTETAPYVGIGDAGLGMGSGPVGWGTAHPLLLFELHQYYGETRLVGEEYDKVKRWIDLLRSQAKEGILVNGISDHESLVPKSPALTGTAFYFANAQLAAQLAGILDKEEEAAGYERLAEEIRRAFNDRFFRDGAYDTGTQACQAFPLFWDMVPGDKEKAAIDRLLQAVANREGRLTTGIFGTKYMLLALTERGKGQEAFDLVHHEEFPGWGYMLANGATTLWEHWAFSDDTFSHNHPMFGSVSEWFFKALAGIRPHPQSKGFDRFSISPFFPEKLSWVEASYDSVRGTVKVRWERKGDEIVLDAKVPVSSQAELHLPQGEKPVFLGPGEHRFSISGGTETSFP